ncbi:unnamed protein product [[Actinomadura] parvosata subsp. kistnae]|uniref:hypothetical protein n=1 Tax=[Actinomadura] parvosata TaxID=1955412 RepID=UPI000D2A7681|nr:unnamed protein product [Actinomadura parvosata subsp. kistnae]
MLDVSRALFRHVAGLLRDERRRLGTPEGSRALTPFWQAVLVLRWFPGESDIPKLGRDHRGDGRAYARPDEHGPALLHLRGANDSVQQFRVLQRLEVLGNDPGQRADLIAVGASDHHEP